MGKRVDRSLWREVFGLVVVLVVFGLAALMVTRHYAAGVIATVITTASLAAMRLIRRLRDMPLNGQAKGDRSRGR